MPWVDVVRWVRIKVSEKLGSHSMQSALTKSIMEAKLWCYFTSRVTADNKLYEMREDILSGYILVKVVSYTR